MNVLRARQRLPLLHSRIATPQRGLITTTLADPGFLSVVPANLLTALSACGMPWLFTIPITALTFRTLLVYPFFVRKKREHEVRLGTHQPLVDAHISIARMKPEIRQASSMFGFRRYVQRERKRAQRRIAKALGIWQLRWPARILAMAILLIVSEAVRRVCGRDQGIFSTLLGPPWDWLIGLFNKVKEGDQINSKIIEKTTTDPDLATLEEPAPTYDVSAWYQPSLQRAGLPWCEDLTMPDPYHILPVIFSGSLFATVWFSGGRRGYGNFYDNPEEAAIKQKPKRTRGQKFLLVMSALSLWPALTMPCALLVYLTSNVFILRLHNAHVARMFPFITPPSACRHPLRDWSRLPPEVRILKVKGSKHA